MSRGMIAIVDDDDAVRDAMASLVRALGYDTATLAPPKHFSTLSRSATHRASSPICICRA